jgi:hypothetical protein
VRGSASLAVQKRASGRLGGLVSSRLVGSDLRGWIALFEKQGWKNLSGETKFNEDLWNRLLKGIAKAAKVGIRVDLVWQAGKKTAIAKQVHKAQHRLPPNGVQLMMTPDIDRGAYRVRW